MASTAPSTQAELPFRVGNNAAMPLPRAVKRFAKLRLSAHLLALRLRERLMFDSPVFRAGYAVLCLLGAFALFVLGKKTKALAVLTRLHSSECGRLSTAIVERVVRRINRNHNLSGSAIASTGVYWSYIQALRPNPSTAAFFNDPGRLLGPMVTVLKSPAARERGAILVNYNYVYGLFARYFDVPRIARKYYFILEPSWSGYCEMDILSFSQYDFPVFVESGEPRDTGFLRRIKTNLIPVPVAGNWWADYRTFTPLSAVAKDADLIMVAGWAKYKRHERLFAALANLKACGLRLRTILVGYACDYTLADIRGLAVHHGVDDLIEYHESLTPQQVNDHMNRARVNIIWSRREGFNRVVIEGMLAGLPCILREGFNYGYRYPFINPQTGTFSSESALPATLRSMVERHGQFTPRSWVMQNMTCFHATSVLNEALKRTALACGERWTSDLAVRVSFLHGARYWDPRDEARFEVDYGFLRTCMKR